MNFVDSVHRRLDIFKIVESHEDYRRESKGSVGDDTDDKLLITMTYGWLADRESVRAGTKSIDSGDK